MDVCLLSKCLVVKFFSYILSKIFCVFILFLTVLVLCCWARAFCGCGVQRYSLVVVHGPLVVASLVGRRL